MGERTGAGLDLDSGWLVVFDRRSGQLPLADRVSDSEQRSAGGGMNAPLRPYRLLGPALALG